MRMELIGVQKTLFVEDASVTIVKHAGPFSAPREKSLPIRNISSVEVKQPGMIFRGFIQFSIAGGHAYNSSFTFSGGTVDAAADENAVVFSGNDNYEIALQIKQYVETFTDESTRPTSGSAADEILKFKKLMDEGIISKEEFEMKKKRLLGS